jgi:hypothetical protein
MSKFIVLEVLEVLLRLEFVGIEPTENADEMGIWRR